MPRGPAGAGPAVAAGRRAHAAARNTVPPAGAGGTAVGASAPARPRPGPVAGAAHPCGGRRPGGAAPRYPRGT